MMNINKHTLGVAEEINLHDAEIKEVICNYYDHVVRIPILKSKLIKELIFREVMSIDISILEPWGAGMYIHEFSVKEDKQKITNYEKSDIKGLHFNILLNSGDNINITASVLEITEVSN